MASQRVSGNRFQVAAAVRQPAEVDLPESGRFWLKETHSGGHVGL
jgi:hypothetical protein